MKERPILFSAPMVNAILEGRKTMTRRVVKTKLNLLRTITNDEFRDASPYPLAADTGNLTHYFMIENGPIGIPCPKGKPGDKLWVRESFVAFDENTPENTGEVFYRADKDYDWIWKPSIFMPRKYSRITLEITDVRVERLQKISGKDCIAEGIPKRRKLSDGTPLEGDIWREAKDEFKALWESINGAGSWEANPWVWVISFKRVENVSKA